jgi:hypothetical protein
MWINNYTYTTTILNRKLRRNQCKQNHMVASYALQVTNLTAEMQMLPAVVPDLEGEQ